jgi:Cu+-exporting ATPase
MGGEAMVRDPVCQIDIDDIDVSPETLQSEYEGKVFHFCSPECKLQFDENPKMYILAA